MYLKHNQIFQINILMEMISLTVHVQYAAFLCLRDPVALQTLKLTAVFLSAEIAKLYMHFCICNPMAWINDGNVIANHSHVEI